MTCVGTQFDAHVHFVLAKFNLKKLSNYKVAPLEESHDKYQLAKQ